VEINQRVILSEQMSPLIIADLILVLHAIFVAVVVGGVPLILLGGWRGWHWVRRRGFRVIHLGMIGFVVLETCIGMTCPLTVWEHALRRQGGGGDDGQDFIAHWVGILLFHHFPHWVFNALYGGFGLLVLSLWWLVPCARKRA
jgi:hypothetical protein